MRTGLRDSALRRVRSVAAGQRGVPGLAEAPAREGTARGERRGGGSLGKRFPRGTAAHLPAACRECLGRPHLTCQRHAKGLMVGPAPISFPPRSVNPKRPGGQGGSPSWHSLAPPPASCPRGQTHRLKAEPSSRGAASSARHSPRWWDLGDRSGTLLCYTVVLLGIRLVTSPTCSSSLASPAPLCKEVEREGGGMEQEGRPQHSHVPLCQVSP